MKSKKGWHRESKRHAYAAMGVKTKKHSKKPVVIIKDIEPSEFGVREYLYGDFDEDETKNIDDPYPFDPDRSDYPDIEDNSDFYHKARYGGTEVNLSDELQAIEMYNNKHIPLMKKILKDNSRSYGRIKTVPSTINKMRKKSLNKISDVGAVTILVKDRKAVYKKANELRKKYKEEPSQLDDFYIKPKNKVYYAYHVGVRGPRKELIEVQIKTKPMKKFHTEMHRAYKENKPLKSYKVKAKRLYKKGY